MGILSIILLVIALLVVPALYICFCLWMAICRAHWLSYIAYFFLFGVVGGGFLALGLSPSGLAASCIVFLVFVAPIGCFLASVALNSRPKRGRFENVAMTIGYAYPATIVMMVMIGLLLNR